MTGRNIRLPEGVQIWTCSGRNKNRCRFCERAAVEQCEFALGGSKAGQKCSAHMCLRCVVKHPTAGGALDYCPPHARMASKDAEP